VIFYPITAILGMKKLSTGKLPTLENYMSDEQPQNTAEVYEIRLQGHLDTKWSEWFYGMTITHERDGITTLYGPLPDQIVLHSVLDRIRDMYLPLLSIKQIVSNGLTRNDEAKGVSHDE
jgi:hypothetical protein